MTPGTDASTWKVSNGESTTNNRISAQLSAPQSSINSASPGGSVVSGSFGPTAAGTTAYIDATVIAGGDVSVWAIDSLDVVGVVGSIGAGLVGVGASVQVLTIAGNTDARIKSHSTITAGGLVSVKARMTETSTPIAFAGSGGFVAFGGVVAVVNDNATQHAEIETSAAGAGGITRADSGVDVEAYAHRTLNAYNIAVAFGVFAGGAGVAVVAVGGNSSAIIGNVALGSTGPVHHLTVSVEDTITSDIFALSVGAGLVSIAGALAFADLNGTASARSGAHGTVGAGGVTVTATGVHTVHVQTLMMQGGLATFGLSVANAFNGRSTEAKVDSTGNVSTSGAVLIKATSTNMSDTTQVVEQIAVSGVNLTVMVRIATVSGGTRVQVDGDFSNASSVTIAAESTNTALTPVEAVGIAIVGLTGAFGFANVTSGAETKVEVGQSAAFTVPGAPVSVTSTSHNTATASVTNTSVAIVAISAMLPSATVAGATTAKFDGDLTNGAVDAANLTVKALSTNLATATVTLIAVTVAGGAGAIAVARVSGDTEAALGSNANVALSGAVLIDASFQGGGNKALALDEIKAISLALTVTITGAKATVSGALRARLDGVVTASSQVTAQAVGTQTADAQIDSISIALGITFSGAASLAEITDTANVEVDSSGGSIASGGAVLVEAKGTFNATSVSSSPLAV